jgi:CPA1 family monovalent cation:H+ antiporter
MGLFAQEILGGIVLGLGVGFLGFWLLKIVDNDHVELEVLITLSMVMGGAQLAEIFEVSGPLAMVVMGIIVGNEGRSEALSNVTGEYVYKFWHLIDESLNAILFILIGLQIIVISFQFEYLVAGLIAIQIVLFSRWVGVGLPIAFMMLRRKFEKNTITILTWGGLRGGISVALALSLPKNLENKDLIVAITYCVVVFSILVQGMTITNFFDVKADPEQPEVTEV